MLPIEFLRQFRIGGYAIFDILAALLGMYLLSLLFSKLFLKMRIQVPTKNWLFMALPIGILSHLIVGNITPMTADFLDPKGHYIIKVIIIVLFVLGIRGIKRIPKEKP